MSQSKISLRAGAIINYLNKEYGNPHTRYSYHNGGKKYSRVIITRFGVNVLYCFVDNNTGDIYPPRNWKSPNRQHIFGNSDEPELCCDVFGVFKDLLKK